MRYRNINCLLFIVAGFCVSGLDLYAKDSSMKTVGDEQKVDSDDTKSKKHCNFINRLLFRCHASKGSDGNGNATEHSNSSENTNKTRSNGKEKSDAGLKSQMNASSVDVIKNDGLDPHAANDHAKKKRCNFINRLLFRCHASKGGDGDVNATDHSNSPENTNKTTSNGKEKSDVGLKPQMNASSVDVTKNDGLDPHAAKDHAKKKRCVFWKRWFSLCHKQKAAFAQLNELDFVTKTEGVGKLGYRGKSQRFTSVVCRGDLSILLDPKATTDGVKAASHHIEYSDSGGTLVLSGTHGSGYDVRISGADLVGQIQSVRLDDACSLEGYGLNQAKWRLDSRTTGNVTLRGVFKKSEIIQSGDNQIDMYWVGSDDVDVYSEIGVMRLAGNVTHSRIKSLGSSQLLLKQLRSQHGWISASDNAYIEVFGSKRFVVFMDGNGQVLSEGVPLLSSEVSNGRSMFVIDD